ncbi:MAG: hypothetical protein IJI19_04415, partial [Ruminococcus sp.]|nr:hypothetical protein [Ruminococcus sp.]
TAQFTVTPQNGSLEIAKREVTVTATGGSKEYDGSALTAEATGYTISSGSLASGQTETVVLSGEQTLVGSATAKVESVTIKSGETDVTENYAITKVNGTLTITNREAKYEITLVANSNTGNTYDGTEKEAKGVVTNKFTFDGVEYTVSGFTTSDPKTADAGTYPNNIPAENGYTVKDPAGNDVSEQFAVKPQNGSLEIAKRAITVTATGGSKQYDGSALTAEATGYTISSGSLASGQTETVVLSGERTLVGSATAKVESVTIKSGETDVTENYDITKVDGTLTITNREAKYKITLVANSSTGNTYDGTEKSAIGVETDKFTFDNVEYTVSGFTTSDPKETDAGTYPNNITSNGYVVTDPDGNDVSDQFAVTPQNGSLEIAKAGLTITADDKTKIYGDPDPKLTATVKTLIGDDTIEYELSREEGEDVGEYTIFVTPLTKRAASNYDITYVNGKFTITKAPLTVTADDKTKTYGDPDPDLTATVSGLKRNDTESVVSYALSRAKGEDVGTYDITAEASGEGPKNYDVTYEKGEFTIEKAVITVGGKFDVSEPEDVMYNGQEQKQPVTIKHGDKELTEGTDFDLTYSDDVTNAGTVTITITGKNNYTGVVKLTYEITPRKVVLTSESATKRHDGKPLTRPEVTISGDGFVEGEVTDIIATGSITDPGSVINTITYTENESFK